MSVAGTIRPSLSSTLFLDGADKEEVEVFSKKEGEDRRYTGITIKATVPYIKGAELVQYRSAGETFYELAEHEHERFRHAARFTRRGKTGAAASPKIRTKEEECAKPGGLTCKFCDLKAGTAVKNAQGNTLYYANVTLFGQDHKGIMPSFVGTRLHGVARDQLNFGESQHLCRMCDGVRSYDQRVGTQGGPGKYDTSSARVVVPNRPLADGPARQAVTQAPNHKTKGMPHLIELVVSHGGDASELDGWWSEIVEKHTQYVSPGGKRFDRASRALRELGYGEPEKKRNRKK